MNLQVTTPQFALLLGILTVCEAWQSYSSIYRKRPTSYPWNYRRGSSLDRLSMNFIKRSDAMVPEYTDADYREAINELLNSYESNEDVPSTYNPYEKRHFDRIDNGFIRKRRSTDEAPNQVAGQTGSPEQKSTSSDLEKRRLDRLSYSIVKKNNDGISDDSGIEDLEDDTTYLHDDKRALDRLTGFVKRPFDRLSGLVKRPLDRLSSFVKRPFDEMPIGLINKDLVDGEFVLGDNFGMDQRHMNRFSSGFGTDDDRDHVNAKRRLDRLSGFVKKSEPDAQEGYEEEKRRFDRLNSFVKKSDTDGYGQEKRHFDRLNSFVKKSETGGFGKEKRRFDRLNSFVKKSDADGFGEEKRHFDRLNSFVKKSETGGFGKQKRRFDRLNSFVKKSETEASNDSIDDEKRRLDRLGAFVKKADETVGPYEDSEMDANDLSKRRLDRLSSSFVKRRLNEMSSALMTTSDEINTEKDKRRVDRLSSFI